MRGGLWEGVDIGGTKTAIVLSSEPPSVLRSFFDRKAKTRPAWGAVARGAL